MSIISMVQHHSIAEANSSNQNLERHRNVNSDQNSCQGSNCCNIFYICHGRWMLGGLHCYAQVIA